MKFPIAVKEICYLRIALARLEGSAVSMTYYDSVSGRTRIKRRYVWGTWGYLFGALTILAVHFIL